MFSVELWDVTGGQPIMPAQLKLTPRWYTAAARGGPERAEILVEGDGDALWQILDWLHYRIKIRNDNGTLVWWGFVSEALVGLGSALVGRSLTGLANYVSVAYTYEEASGSQARATTAWAQNAASIATYGTFAERVSLADADATAAEAYRATVLAQRGAPPAIVRLGEEKGALLLCEGWWSTLGRQFYSDARGVEEHDAAASLEHPIGWALTAATIGFNENRIDDVLARLGAVRAQNTLRVGGSTSNDGAYTVQSAPDSDATAQTYTAATISYEVQDDIRDSADGLGWARLGYMIDSSSVQSGNSGSFWVTKEGVAAIEVTPATITNQAAASFTLKQGHGLNVVNGDGPNGGKFTMEKAGASVSLYHGSLAVAQGFQLESVTGWTVTEIRFTAMKVGSPADNLRVRIYSASGGNPNTVLGTWTVAPADVPTELDWIVVDLGAGLVLSAATDYFLYVDRAGAPDYDDFYCVGLEPAATYARGNLRVYDGILAAWGARATNAHMPFRLTGRTATTAQLADMLDAAQWVATTSMRTVSGVTAPLYRDGEQTILDEVERLLNMGTSTGASLNATVLDDCAVVVEAEATAAGTVDLRLLPNGDVADGLRDRMEEGLLPVGRWIAIEGVPVSLTNASAFFVERAEYEVATGRLHLEPRGLA